MAGKRTSLETGQAPGEKQPAGRGVWVVIKENRECIWLINAGRVGESARPDRPMRNYN